MRKIKLLIYLVLILIAAFLFWFLPKYSFIHKNPGFCTPLSTHLYYCGNSAHLDSFFNVLDKTK